MNALTGSLTESERTLLAVPGMHCAGCISKIESGLGKVPGIHGARANLSARTVTVDHEQQVDTHDLVRTLAGLGFEAQARRDEIAPDHSAARSLLAPLAVAGFA